MISTHRISPVLVIAPHPDDEVLGVGGTIARLADEGRHVTVVIVTKGNAEFFDAGLIEQGRREAREAHRLLGVAHTAFLDLPAARLDQVPHMALNAALLQVIEETRPGLVFVPFRGDLHRDHQLVFDSTLVAVRPINGLVVSEILSYETLSETNWNASRSITAALYRIVMSALTSIWPRSLVGWQRTRPSSTNSHMNAHWSPWRLSLVIAEQRLGRRLQKRS